MNKFFITLAVLLWMAGSSVMGQKVGEKAPGFVATTLNGEKLDLQSYKGKAVILDFWASWCAPCLKEMPFLIEMQEKYKDKNLAIIAVNIDNDRKNVLKFIKKIGKNVPFPIIFDKEKALPKLYKPEAMPTTIFIDPEGVIRYRHKGFREKDTSLFIAEIEKLIKK